MEGQRSTGAIFVNDQFEKNKRLANFVSEAVAADRQAGKHGGRVVTRFPPEPNGYLHIGHAKSICLNFGLALDFQGDCHLRFDDTNPTTEDVEYVESIQNDLRWLGFDWKDKLFFASDYYERLYDFAVGLIKVSKAYVCSLSEEDIRKYRGTAFEPGRASPYRDRTVEENLDLFARMRKGEFSDGAHVLRAKIDMANSNLKMRDWPLYRIRHERHYRTGTSWCIYPLYDFAHSLSDAIEGVTHSICTLEFENNRELYDWILNAAGFVKDDRPQQLEFARLNLAHTVMSKRQLLQFVESKQVSGWDDPRLPTIAGLRRRGVTPEAVRAFCDQIGVAKNNSIVEMALFEHVVRDNLNLCSPRVMCVLKPLKVVIENYPADIESELLEAPYWPADFGREGSRKLLFAREIFIERDDFMENPSKDFFRLALGCEVRLRHGYVIRCTGVVRNAFGEIVELLCTYDVTSLGQTKPGGRKIKGTVHWVCANQALPVELRLYDRLLDNKGELNHNSLITLHGLAERSLSTAKPGERFQFERTGFFCVDSVDTESDMLIFNRTVSLKDSWSKLAVKQ